jgi:hypothetical protein
MSDFEHNPGNFSLFRNRNPKSEKAPSHTGSAKIALPDGGEMKLELAAWLKEKNGKKYFSGTIKEPEEKWEGSYQEQQATVDEDEDVPF